MNKTTRLRGSMNDSTIQSIQVAFEEGRPIQIRERHIHLFLHDQNVDNDYLARAIEWLKLSLTEDVHTVRLQMIGGYNASDEQKLYDLAKSRKKLEIYADQYGDEYDYIALTTIAFKKRISKTIIRATYLHPGLRFDFWIPKEIPDILTNNGAIKLSTENLFRSVTIEKDSPSSPVTITGISFEDVISEKSEEYLEFVSKIPTLNAIQYDLNFGDKMDKVIEFLKVNASNLREINFIGPYRGYKESTISKVNYVIMQFKTLSTLGLKLCATDVCSIELEALAENTNIKRLVLSNASNFDDYMALLRRNETINDLSIDFTIENDNPIPRAKELMQILAEKTCLRSLAIGITFRRHCECADEMYDELLLTALANTNITSLRLINASFADKYDHVTQGRRSRSCSRERCGKVSARSRSRSRGIERSRSRSRSPERPSSRRESMSRSTSRSRSNSRGRKRNRSNSPSEERETKRQKIFDNDGDTGNQRNWSGGKQKLIQLMLANPHLTRVEVTEGDNSRCYKHKLIVRDIPAVLQHHLDENKRKRDETCIGLITLMYNIAQSKSDAHLPQEVWCHIVSFIEYPGIDQPFNHILQELFKNSTVRRIIKE